MREFKCEAENLTGVQNLQATCFQTGKKMLSSVQYDDLRNDRLGQGVCVCVCVCIGQREAAADTEQPPGPGNGNVRKLDKPFPFFFFFPSITASCLLSAGKCDYNFFQPKPMGMKPRPLVSFVVETSWSFKTGFYTKSSVSGISFHFPAENSQFYC